jgi:peptide/nickel transport system substrate-binding protein
MAFIASGNQINLAGARAGSGGLAHRHFVKQAPDVPDQFIEPLTLENFGNEGALWFQHLPGHIEGQFQVSTPWYSFALASGDAWPEIRGWHPDFYVPVGEDYRSLGGGNFQRINDPRVGELIDAMAAVEPGSEENHELVTDFLKHWTEEMYFITTISFKKFVTWDERYWTGFPTAENAERMPLYWFQGGKYTFQGLRPTAE